MRRRRGPLALPAEQGGRGALRRLGLHRRAPPRRGRPARRLPGDHPLGGDRLPEAVHRGEGGRTAIRATSMTATVFTGGGISSSIDLSLFMVETIVAEMSGDAGRRPLRLASRSSCRSSTIPQPPNPRRRPRSVDPQRSRRPWRRACRLSTTASATRSGSSSARTRENGAPRRISNLRPPDS